MSDFDNNNKKKYRTGAAPQVSIVMPNYNSERYISEAISSVIRQTYPNWELLVIDDDSYDRSVSIVREFESKDPRIHLVVNEKNLGTARTRNRGMSLCRGEYVALLDSDDIWEPGKLEKQMEVAERTGADIIYCSYGLVDEHDHKLCRDFIVVPETDFDQMLKSSVISCSTAVLSREAADRYRFSDSYQHEDYALWMEMLQDGCRARGTQEVLAEYRVHTGSRAHDKARAAKGRWEIYRKALNLPRWKCLAAFLAYGVNGLMKYRHRRFAPGRAGF